MPRSGPAPIVSAAAAVCFLAGLPGCSWQSSPMGSTNRPVTFPPPPAAPRIAYVGDISDATVMGKRPNRLARFLFGHDPEEPQTIRKPFGLAVGNETLLVCDTQRNVVHVLDFKRHRFETMGGSGSGRLLKPVAVALDQQGNRYVADTTRREVVVFGPDNQALRALGGSRESFKPVAVACRQGKLYVLNSAAHRLEVLNPTTGKLLATIGEKGQKAGQMLFPNGLSIDAAGRIYVTDMMNCRVEVFAADGRLLRTIGRPGDRAGQFSRPKHLAVGPDGIIYVVDAGFQRVQMFDSQGRVLMLFGGPGTDPGRLTLPAGICVDRTLLPYFADRLPAGFEAKYLIFVGDQVGLRKVMVYAFGQAVGKPGEVSGGSEPASDAARTASAR